MKLISLVISGVALISSGFGQSKAVIPAPQASDTVVEIADQPDCPVRLSLKTIQGETPRVLIYLSTLSDKPVLGFAVVKQGDTNADLFGNASPGTPLVRDAEPSIVNALASQPGRFVLRVDFVQFADGTSWGKDEYQQSKPINDFIQGWKIVDQRLREIASSYPDPDFFIKMMLQVRPGWAAPIRKDNDRPIAVDPHMKERAYEAILMTLRRHGSRDAEAQEIARKLELMRTPAPNDK